MRRGERPQATLAILYSFMAGVYFTLGFSHESAATLVIASAYAIVGPIAWFVGRP